MAKEKVGDIARDEFRRTVPGPIGRASPVDCSQFVYLNVIRQLCVRVIYVDYLCLVRG